jgi:hypothetical protein
LKARNGSRKVMHHTSSHQAGFGKQSQLRFWSEGKQGYSDYMSKANAKMSKNWIILCNRKVNNSRA